MCVLGVWYAFLGVWYTLLAAASNFRQDLGEVFDRFRLCFNFGAQFPDKFVTHSARYCLA